MAKKSLKPVSFMSIKTQFDNLGDAIINRELAKLISSRSHLTVDLTRSPTTFHESMSLSELSNCKFITKRKGKIFVEMVISVIQGNKCYFFLNPGGLGGGVGNSNKSFISAMVYNIILLALKLIGIKICQVGVSFEKLTKKELIATRIRRKLCHSFNVRDNESYDYLKSIGILPDGIVPDLSFNLYATSTERPQQPTYSAAFSFRTDKGTPIDTIKDFALRTIQNSESEDAFLFLSQVGRDADGMKEIYNYVKEKVPHGKVTYSDLHSDFNDAIDAYSRTRKTYSNRLHVLLFCAYAGAIPIAAIQQGRQRKIESLFADLGYESNIITFNSGTRLEAKEIEKTIMNDELAKLNNYFDKLLKN